MKKNILLIGYNFSPEPIGIGKYTGELAAYLAQQGHKVEVVTAYPYYPDWHIAKSYRSYWFSKIHIQGAAVQRCPIYLTKKASGFGRIALEISFFISSFLAVTALLFGRKKYDTVLVISPSFLSGFVGLWYKFWYRKTRLIYHVQDLQVDAALALGLIKNKSLIRLLLAAERLILRKADVWSTISAGMQAKLLEKGADPEKSLLFPNWVDTDVIRPLTKAQSLRKAFGLKADDRVVLYSGNLGEKQGLEAIVGLAKHFQTQKEIQFLICGSGAAEGRLKTLVREASLSNVHFYPLQPAEKLAALLATADIHLVLQKKSASDLVMPSKLTGIWAAGGFVLVTASPGTAIFELIKSNDLGIIVEPESEKALITTLAFALKTDLKPFRDRARAFAEKNLSKNIILSNFERSL